MAYELEALATGWRMGLHTADWKNLVALAYQYGWTPTAGTDRYPNKGKQIIPASEMRTLAAALRRALADLPPERRKEFRPPTVPRGSVAEAMHFGADPEDPKNYFAWERRWIVEEVIRLCGRGTLEFRPM